MQATIGVLSPTLLEVKLHSVQTLLLVSTYGIQSSDGSINNKLIVFFLYNINNAVAELRDLVNELTEVNNWIPLGLNLGIKISTLEAIEMERITIGERRTQMLIAWQRQETPTWSGVIRGLVGIGTRSLASKLARKHG